MKRFLLVVLLCLPAFRLVGQPLRCVCWNVENFFDVIDDSLTRDDEFTPAGDHHWTYARFAEKRNNIYKTILDMGGRRGNLPAVVGLVEVENDRVLDELCRNTPLRNLGYDYIHYDSPDARGIDCALLYRSSRFVPFFSQPISLSDTARGFRTRDLLLVEGVARRDTVCVVVCHLPSKRGGTQASSHRLRAAQKLRYVLDTLQAAHPKAVVMAMGDFNANSSEEAFTEGLGFVDGVNTSGFRDLMAFMSDDEGTYKYKELWDCIDHIIVNRPLKAEIFKADYLMKPDANGLGRHPFRTYAGPKYLGGISDHLPVMVDIK